MPWGVLHRLVVALTLLAFVGGMTLQLMPPKLAFTAGAMPGIDDCSHMTMPPDDAGTGQKAPCKGSDLPECIKQMGCLGTPNLPLRLGTDVVPFAYGKVVYWTPAVGRDGRSIKPDLLPPIGL
jgi:hypothetical protein